MSRRLALALCLLLVPVTLAADPGPVPDIDTFMQIGFAGSPRIAPDGRTVFFSSNASGVSQVYRREDGTGWPYQLTVFTEGVDFYTLSPDGRSIVCGVGLGGDENAQLWLVDARSGSATALTADEKVRHGSPTWTANGRTIFYSSNEANGKDFYVYRMDLDSGKKSLVFKKAGWNDPGDLSDDDRFLMVDHANSNLDNDLYLLDLKRNRETHLTPHEGDVLHAAAQFNADASALYLLTNGNPDGVLRRARLDLDGRTLTYLDPGNPWEVQLLGISPDRQTMGWALNEDGYVRLRLRDLVQDRELPVPPVDGDISSFAFSRVGSLVFGFSSATSTADIWRWDWKAPALEKLTHSTYAGIDPGLFTPPTLVRYPTFDGREIPAFLYLPPTYRPGTPVPFVIHVHGGPESQFRPVFIRHFQYLLLNGYGILAPNVRGSSGYGKEYVDLDNYKKRLDSVKDLKAGADYLLARGYTAPGMLAVKGGSYGGYMTLAAITEYPDLFSAAVDEVGISNFVTFLENTAEYRRYLREAEYGPLSDREFLTSISPIHKAGLIKTPLMVVHGENDPRVPVDEARQIIDAIKANGGEVQSLIFEDEGHGSGRRENTMVLYRQMIEFLDRHLKGSGTGDGTE